MNIVLVGPLYLPAIGGAEWHLKEIAEGLARRGHEVTVVTANARSARDVAEGIDGGLAEFEVINGVKVLRFRPDGGRWGSLWWRIPGATRCLSLVLGKERTQLLAGRPLLVELIPYLARTRADIVASMSWYWPPAYHTHLARKLHRFTLVGIPIFHTAETWSYRGIYKTMLASCDAVITNTTYEANFVRERAATRVEVAGVGIDPRSFDCRNGSELRTRYGLGTFPVVGFVGRQHTSKGLITLLQAMKTVWKWNSDVRLVLAGPLSNRAKEVATAIEGLPNFEKERLVDIGTFSERDKASIYDSFDVFVLPSMAESFGIAYLEAWACGKPVIGARIGPTQCVIDEGIDGLLVDSNDPQDIARAIIALLSDREMRERMGRSGHAKTIAQYTWDKVTDKVEKLYLELVAAKRISAPSFSQVERPSR